MNSLFLLPQEYLNFFLFVKDSFAGYKNSWLTDLLFQDLECVILLPSGLHSFSWEISCQSYWGALVWDKSHPSWFQESLSLSFDRLIMMCVGVGLFDFILCRVCRTSWVCRLTFLIKSGEYLPFFLQYSFWPLFFFSPSWTPLCMHMLVHLIVSHKSPSSVYFSFFSFLFGRQSNLNWLIFADSFFYLLDSAVETLWSIFHFIYYSFQLQNFHFFKFLSLYWYFLFPETWFSSFLLIV